MEYGVGGNSTRVRIFIPDTGTHPFTRNDPSQPVSVAQKQTVDHVILQCPIYRPPHGLHGVTVLDVETTEWILNTCPEI